MIVAPSGTRKSEAYKIIKHTLQFADKSLQDEGKDFRTYLDSHPYYSMQEKKPRWIWPSLLKHTLVRI